MVAHWRGPSGGRRVPPALPSSGLPRPPAIFFFFRAPKDRAKTEPGGEEEEKKKRKAYEAIYHNNVRKNAQILCYRLVSNTKNMQDVMMWTSTAYINDYITLKA